MGVYLTDRMLRVVRQQRQVASGGGAAEQVTLLVERRQREVVISGDIRQVYVMPCRNQVAQEYRDLPLRLYPDFWWLVVCPPVTTVETPRVMR